MLRSILREAIGAARIVAVGQSGFDTREFWQAKRRLLEFLAADMGFTVLAVQMNWPDSLAATEYVATGRGDPAEALQGLGAPWNAPEMLETLRWVRRHKVRFAAFDVQTASLAVRNVLAYLQRVDPAGADEYARILDEVTTPEKEARQYRALPGHEKRLIGGAAEEFVQRFDRRKAEYVAKSSEAEWALARRYADFARQAVTLQDPGSRDRHMADNVKAILEGEPTGAKVVLWAYYAHVRTTEAGTAAQSMGEHLRRMYGDALVTIGLVANPGSFATGSPLTAMDLRRTLKSGPVAEWLARQQGLAKAFDVLLFVDHGEQHERVLQASLP